ncbi:MAG: 16S rRNA (guanine(527)-N(7))-methyltransferase RsmG [Clostridia bacterium]|nr:16S rRNA (guanine(527)-N(7))-methyltransferase RsmG [Clostridia bacterium]
MEEKEFKEELLKRAKQFQRGLSEKEQNQFYQYMQLLLMWNEKMNLTAIIEPKEILIKHFIDSMSISPYIEENEKVLDVGTGAGFPGIPLKIVLSQNNFTLLDSLNKRINFLNEVIRNLKLEKIETVHGRAEEFCKIAKRREGYDIVTSRAVAKLNTLLEYMLPFVKIGGKCICMKSLEIEEELNNANRAIEILGGEVEKVETITLENTDITRKIVIIKKIKETPKKYPRKAGMPSKDPII